MSVDQQHSHWARYYGPRLWAQLHLWSQVADLRRADEWLKVFSSRISCGECRQRWWQIIEEMPPDRSNHRALFIWSVQIHNAVNRRLGKSVVSCEAAMSIWRCDLPRFQSLIANIGMFHLPAALNSHRPSDGSSDFASLVVNPPGLPISRSAAAMNSCICVV